MVLLGSLKRGDRDHWEKATIYDGGTVCVNTPNDGITRLATQLVVIDEGHVSLVSFHFTVAFSLHHQMTRAEPYQ